MCALSALPVHPVTFVYNLKIAPNTKLQSLRIQNKCPHIVAFTPIQQWKKKYDGTQQTAGGGLGSYINNHYPWYFEIDWAAAEVKQSNFSRIQTDDILFTGGYSRIFSKTNRGTISALLGLPTHADHIFSPLQFGLNHVSLGVQLDDSWSYSCNKKHILFSAFRYLHFFSRNVVNCVDDKEFEYNFNIGNTIDLLIAHATNWNRHKVEIGYNPTFVFGSSISPALPIVPHSVNGIRNGFYLDYRYAFATKKRLGAISVGVSYSFDSIPKDVGFKRIISTWVTVGVCF